MSSKVTNLLSFSQQTMTGVIAVIGCLIMTGIDAVPLDQGQDSMSLTMDETMSRSQQQQSASPIEQFLKSIPLPKLPKITSISPIVPSSITLPSEGSIAMTPLGKLVYPKDVAPAIRAPSQDLKFGDGDIVDRKVYIYKCKICDMPRLFKMKYGSFIF